MTSESEHRGDVLVKHVDVAKRPRIDAPFVVTLSRILRHSTPEKSFARSQASTNEASISVGVPAPNPRPFIWYYRIYIYIYI